MSDLDKLLAAIAANPGDDTAWCAMEDCVKEEDDIRRGELLDLQRDLQRTCCEPDAHPDRKEWHARIVGLIAEGVQPCVPQKTVLLPGGIPMTFSFIPPGSFLMGGTVADDEQPVHKVTLTRGFFIGIHPVTQTQWKAVMGNDPSDFKGPNRPVEQVTWEDCQDFCQKLTSELMWRVPVRLPTEAEWEYACRAGTTSHHHFGDTINTDLVNFNGIEAWCTTTNVDTFKSNAWGLFDMHGNVWEWCEDWYGEYAGGEETDPQGQSDGLSCVIRGGSFDDGGRDCRSASRGDHLPDGCFIHHIGFRLLMPLDL